MNNKDWLDLMCEKHPKAFVVMGFVIIGAYAAFAFLTLLLMVLGVIWLWRAVA